MKKDSWDWVDFNNTVGCIILLIVFILALPSIIRSCKEDSAKMKAHYEQVEQRIKTAID